MFNHTRTISGFVLIFSVTLALSACGGSSSTPTPTPAATWSGTKQLGVATKDTFGRGVATDSSSNVFVAGDTKGNLDGQLINGTRDFFVTKYDSLGAKKWTKLLGVTSKNTYGNGVATDSSGNVFVAGYTDGDLDGTRTGTFDFFVTKYDTDGFHQWTRQLGVISETTFGQSVATDGSNVFVAGYTSGSLPLNTLAGTDDFFVTKYDTDGIHQWTKQLGVASASTTGLGVATDGSDNIFVAGVTDGGLDGNTLTGTQDFFVTKYNSAGTKQ